MKPVDYEHVYNKMGEVFLAADLDMKPIPKYTKLSNDEQDRFKRITDAIREVIQTLNG